MVTWLILLVLFLLVLLLAKWAWWPSRRLPGNRVRHHRIRVRLRLHPGRGHATVVELWWRWGRWAAFRRSARTRYSMGLWARVAAGAWACSILLGRGHYRHRLHIGLEEHVLVMAPPRTGKSGWLGYVVLHYPGPVLSTTTRADVYENTAAARARIGPVAVFNPQGVGGVPSTFSWNLIRGCSDPAVAIRRADGFARAVSQKGVEDASFWASKASDYLRAAFCAADLLGGDLRMVARWMLSGDASEAEAVLLKFRMDQWADQLAELRSPAAKTIATVKMTISRALAFLADPSLAISVLDTGGGFDIEDFLARNGTLYMIAEGADEESPMAPLFACLCTEIHHMGALLGSHQPGGRLDPPLLMALDEVTQICPVPLPHWMADSGGKGIQVIAVVHGVAQMRSRWGNDGARVIMDTSGVQLYLPGITDDDTLEAASKLTGSVAFKENGHDGSSRHPVMTPEMISRLPERRALVLRGGLAPVVATLPMVWQDPLCKRAPHYRPTQAVTQASAAGTTHQSAARIVHQAAQITYRADVADWDSTRAVDSPGTDWAPEAAGPEWAASASPQDWPHADAPWTRSGR
jgi:type IV secretion system protein VirD4